VAATGTAAARMSSPIAMNLASLVIILPNTVPPEAQRRQERDSYLFRQVKGLSLSTSR
jgi:hypothetical protein